MNENKILVYRVAPYCAINIEINTASNLAKKLGWKCDMFASLDTLKRYLIQINSPERFNLTIDVASQILLIPGAAVVRIIDNHFSPIYCSLQGFDEENSAKKWLRSYCKVFEYFYNEVQLKQFVVTYDGSDKGEMYRAIATWLERK